MIWAHWPSWLVELLSGVLTLALAVGVTALIPARWLHERERLALIIVLAMLLSFTYERFIDPHGWNWVDIGQRADGIVVAFAVWLLL